MANKFRVPFGNLKIDDAAKLRLSSALARNWISEGPFVAEFEEKFAEKFGWKHAIATSSGTDAGIVIWSAIRELSGLPHITQSAKDITSNKGYVITPACAFVATANCILAAGLEPFFYDIELETLNLSPALVRRHMDEWRDLEELVGIQFVATMGKPTPVKEVAEIAKKHDVYLVGDFCEAHGAELVEKIFPVDIKVGADRYCDAAIYSFYAAHLIVGGEGGMICTDDDELAALCRSIKSHGRPAGSTYFDFQRVGFNSKWNDLCAAVALSGLENFDEIFARRRELRTELLELLTPLEDELVLFRDGTGEIISPHAFPLLTRNADYYPRDDLYEYLESFGIQCKTLFGSLPTQHAAFKFLGYSEGDFPVAERIGRTGLHFGLPADMTDGDLYHIAWCIGRFWGR